MQSRIERSVNTCVFTLRDETLHVLPSGGLWWPDQQSLIVADLHLGKSKRIARRGGGLLPPYEGLDTLFRLDADITATGAARVVCLGDSFDDDAAQRALGSAEQELLSRLQKQCDWVWVTGNHDPGVGGLSGTVLSDMRLGSLTLRHIAEAGTDGELSGHYHPKARLTLRGKTISRPCCLVDQSRAILPAYGTYTGGLDWRDKAFNGLFEAQAMAILTGQRPCRVPYRGGEISASSHV
ncbi:ligase-associated DNA damage response endonuclease PdeM [Palleronia caenipelagi]|uniref:Ligase-associated DNA damage response endonuclease PdeM n=1 Tax=Palleronia caenipelagi TaxID=2489174 RepID=A0A547Q7V4_9RHOB|nr:ligase-associated DNA damage response endonuclease PdeM [Palleronia caenipelagi]TRD22477.1 ligase-associated DNA damage response endonuclease PdeM [Palleronia caenipelagi]